MKTMKKLSALFLSLALTLSLVAPALPAAQAAGAVEGTTYYVSTRNGSDSYNGTGESTPFYSLNKINALTLGAGDKVLLERGSVFENQYLHIKGRGAEGAPIVIDAYGAGEKPLINTNGQGVWYQNYGNSLDNSNHVWRGYVSSSIHLLDVEYIEISNIAMTNWGGVEDGATVTGESARNDKGTAGSYTWGNKMNRTGVSAVTQDIGTADHIHLKNLDIENIYGNVYDKHMNNGGIYFTVARPHDETKTGISRYNDVLIEGCYLNRTSRWGIAVAYTAYHAKFNPTAIADDLCQKYGATNVVIRNNYLEEVGGDPITTMYAFKPLIEYNVALHGAREINGTYHNDPGKGNKGTVAAGIWPWKCKTALFQFNECYALIQNQDAQAWDADSGDSTIYQYNYSSDNGGGCIMYCNVQAYNTAFRYNISYKDGPNTGVLNTCGAPNGKYYNNTFVVADTSTIIRAGMSGGTSTLENNIFYTLGSTERTDDFKLQDSKGLTYNNNLFCNYTAASVATAGDGNAMTTADVADIFADPTLTGAPMRPKNTAKGAGGDHGWTHDWAADFNMFKLSENSVAINAGKTINLLDGLGSDHGVPSATQDFYGNILDTTPDLGAHDTGDTTAPLILTSNVYVVNQTANTIAKVPEGTTVATLLANLTPSRGTAQVKKDGAVLQGADIVTTDCEVVLSDDAETKTYIFAKDSDKELKSCVFELGKDKTSGALTGDINVPFGVDFPLSVSAFLDGITVAPTATAGVYSGETEIHGNIADGMKLRITAQDGSIAEDYTIRQKNAYNHSGDWINKPTQGNVWFAQTRANDVYSDMTDWGAEWNNWRGDGFASVEHYCICGNIIVNSDKASTSMAFRAPVSGTVQVSFDASSDNTAGHIKFRKMGAANTSTGTISMLITQNGATLPGHTYVLSKTEEVPVETFTMTVTQGDMLRFEAQNLGNTPDAGFSMVPVITYVKEEVAEGDTTAPTAPANVAVAPADNSATVTWGASTDEVGVTGYKVYLDGAAEPVGTTDGETRTYTLTGLTPWTEYTVKISAVDAEGNESGKTEKTFKTTDSEAPDAPANVAVTENSVTTTAASLTWDVSADNVGVTKYVVTYTPAEGIPLTREVITNACDLTGLRHSTAYSVSVVAKDAAGNTSEAGETSFTTEVSEDTTAPSVPTGLEFTNVTTDGATVSWIAVEDTDSDLDGYTVYWTDGKTTASATVAADAVTYDITGLADLTKYTVTVDAYDTSGNHSAASAEAEFTTLDGTAPSTPGNVQADASDYENVTVTWEASTDNSGTAPEYVVTLKLDGTPKGDPQTVTDLTADFTDLTENTTYTVSVVAKDSAGNASHEGTASFTTPAAPDTQPPAKPAYLAVSGKTMTTATVTWDASTDNVGVVKYVVTYSPTGGESRTTTVTDATSCTLRLLTAGTEYTVAVAAYDTAGNHSESDPVTFETEPVPPEPDTEAPGVPGGLTVSRVTTTGAVLTWTAATDNVGVAKYRIFNGESLVTETTATTYALNGLTAGTSYTFKVIAVDTSDNESDPARVSFATQTESSGPPPSTGGPGGSSSGSTTEKNKDGSTTTTVTDKKTGTVTETTKRPDGSQTVVETKKDGTVTTNDVRKDGVTVEAVTTPDKTTTAAVTVPTAVGKTTVRVPAPAVTPGTVAVLVKEDGTEEVIKLSVVLNGSVVFPLAQSAQIKLVDNSKSFSDVAENSYYRSAVDFVTARDLFRGVSNNAFAPELTLDRGMLVTVLHRLSGGQDLAAAVEAAGKTDFADVESGAWYAESVNWAVKNGVTSGTGAGFAPQAELNREQLAVFLYNYAGKPQMEETYRFADSGKISPWAVQAVSWAIANGILTAGDDSCVNPTSSASRGDAAMVLQNFVKYLAG